MNFKIFHRKGAEAQRNLEDRILEVFCVLSAPLRLCGEALIILNEQDSGNAF